MCIWFSVWPLNEIILGFLNILKGVNCCLVTVWADLFGVFQCSNCYSIWQQECWNWKEKRVVAKEEINSLHLDLKVILITFQSKFILRSICHIFNCHAYFGFACLSSGLQVQQIYQPRKYIYKNKATLSFSCLSSSTLSFLSLSYGFSLPSSLPLPLSPSLPPALSLSLSFQK